MWPRYMLFYLSFDIFKTIGMVFLKIVCNCHKSVVFLQGAVHTNTWCMPCTEQIR